MISRVLLQNYRSFGAPQEIELHPITVLIGANNSGKTSFLSSLQFAKSPSIDAIPHRPPFADGALRLEWSVADVHGAKATWAISVFRFPAGAISSNETVTLGDSVLLSNSFRPENQAGPTFLGEGVGVRGPVVAPNVREIYRQHTGPKYATAVDAVAALLDVQRDARMVHLKVDDLRADSPLLPRTTVEPSGLRLASLIARWQLGSPSKIVEYNEIVRRCIPEIKTVVVHCEVQGHVRLAFEHVDGEVFDASQVSDGVLIFAGLIAHALEAPKNGLVLLEEPERGIHPRRLADLVDLLRTLTHERGTQFVLATHSPALLDVFRDEPEAILAFRRTPQGTAVQPVSKMTDLAETLARADLGSLLANGVFNEDFSK
jgi:energy-coupling factor transporter ATP-binding protein EcfA2